MISWPSDVAKILVHCSGEWRGGGHSGPGAGGSVNPGGRGGSFNPRSKKWLRSPSRGVALKDDAVATTLAVVDSLPGETTASMQRDIMDGRPSELDYQWVVRLGARVGTPTPVHSHFYAALLPMEFHARGEVQF